MNDDEITVAIGSKVAPGWAYLLAGEKLVWCGRIDDLGSVVDDLNFNVVVISKEDEEAFAARFVGKIKKESLQ